jgi:putative DNA primase/helicase
MKKPKQKARRRSTKDISLEIAKSLLDNNRFATMRDSANQTHTEIYRYNPGKGVYELRGVAFIKERVEKGYSRRDATNHLCSEVTGRVERSSYVEREEFDKDPKVVNLQNGLFDPNAGRLVNHTPDYLSRIQLPFKYDPAMSAPKFQKFLTEVQADPKVRELLLEEMAYCFFPDCRLEKAFVYVGSGSNGKTVFLKVLQAFFGRKNVSERSLHQLEQDRFAKADLDGKIANIYPDLSADDLRTTGVIKPLVSGEQLTVENKFGQPFTMIPRAKHFYSCNKLPDTPEDRTPAFFRRWILTEWNVTFEHGGKIEPDKNLTAKLITQDELSGIFNLVFSRYQKLQKRLEFTIEPTIEATTKDWVEKADVVQAFINETYVEDYDSCVTAEDVYDEYHKFCRRRKAVPLGIRNFTQQFGAKSGAVHDRVVRWGSKEFSQQTYIWKKIRQKT